MQSWVSTKVKQPVEAQQCHPVHFELSELTVQPSNSDSIWILSVPSVGRVARYKVNTPHTSNLSLSDLKSLDADSGSNAVPGSLRVRLLGRSLVHQVAEDL